MEFPFSLFVVAYFLVGLLMTVYTVYRLLRFGTLSLQLSGCALVTVLPLIVLLVSGLFADSIDENPHVQSKEQLFGTYSSDHFRLTLNSDGTFTASGLASASQGTWHHRGFHFTLDDTGLEPRLISCNGLICIAPFYNVNGGDIGVLLKRIEAPKADTNH
jgi:hypothetical protein